MTIATEAIRVRVRLVDELRLIADKLARENDLGAAHIIRARCRLRAEELSAIIERLQTDDVAVGEPTTPTLSPNLAAILERHGVPATVDGILDAFVERQQGLGFSYGAARKQHQRWRVWLTGDQWTEPFDGPTPLTALARAFAAIVETDE